MMLVVRPSAIRSGYVQTFNQDVPGSSPGALTILCRLRSCGVASIARKSYGVTSDAGVYPHPYRSKRPDPPRPPSPQSTPPQPFPPSVSR